MWSRLALLSLFVLLACERPARERPRPASVATTPPAPFDDRSLPLAQRADLLVEHFAGLLERGDSIGLLPFVTPDGWRPDTAAAGAVLADYRRHFRDRPVAGWYRVRVAGDSAVARAHLGATLHYELIAHGNLRKTIAVAYDPIQDRMRPWDEFLLYSPRVHDYALAVTDAIRRGDEQRLARLLSPDDEDFPVATATDGIARYGRELDVPTMAVHFDGLAPPRRGMRTTDVARPFRFVIEGTRQGSAVRHEVLVRHGDGMIWWDDRWILEADSAQAG